MLAIHAAVRRSRGFDHYTGLQLRWDLIGQYRNELSKRERRRYKGKFADLPTADHVGDGTGAASFRICSWRVNEFVMRLRRMVGAGGMRAHRPPAPEAPVDRNLRLLADVAGLSELDRAVLTFAVACHHNGEMEAMLDPLPCKSPAGVAAVVAAALAQPRAPVEAALRRNGRLVFAGLMSLNRSHSDVDDWLEVDARVVDLATTRRLDRARVVEIFLPAAPAPSLARSDYEHLAVPLDLSLRLRGAALGARRRGVNLLIHGPTGTGKSELARLLAAELGTPLYVTGGEDAAGMSPNAYERLTSLMLGNRMLARTRALLLFDEADSFLRDRRNARAHWEITLTNEFLQQLEVHRGIVACTTNLQRELDQASVRRFSFKIPFSYLTSGRAWAMFERTLADLAGAPDMAAPDLASVRPDLDRLTNLTPGDFAVVARRLRTIGVVPSARQLLDELRAELAAKGPVSGRAGFVAARA